MMILLLLAASGLGYRILRQKNSQTRVKAVRWEKLGHRSPEDPKV
jgi:hypothetical protein